MSILTFEQAIGLAHFPPFFVSSASTNRFTVQLNATTQVTLTGNFVKPGSGAYTVSYDAPQFGRLDSFVVQTVNAGGHVIGSETVTGHFPTMQQLFNEVIYPAAAARNSIAWNQILPAEAPIPLDGLSGEIDLQNIDGTWTVLRGFGFTFDPTGAPNLNSGTVTAIEQWNSTGTQFLQGTNLFSTELGGQVQVSLGLVYAGLFDNLAAQAFFARLLAGATDLVKTGNLAQIEGPFEPYLNGATFNAGAGDDSFSGGLGNDF